MSLGNWEDKDGDEAEPEELPDVDVIKIPAIGWGDGYRAAAHTRGLLGLYTLFCTSGRKAFFIFCSSGQK